MDRSNQPRWYLYLALPLLMGLFLLESHLGIDRLLHQLLQLTIVFFVFGLVYLYVGRVGARCCHDR